LVHEHVVLGPAKTGIDLAPRKSVSQERLAGFHPIDRLLQAPERIGVFNTKSLKI
jgi:hypothetical protein